MKNKNKASQYLEWCAERKGAPRFKEPQPFFGLCAAKIIKLGTMIMVSRGGVSTYYRVDEYQRLQRVFMVYTTDQNRQIVKSLHVTSTRFLPKDLLVEVDFWNFFELAQK